MACVKGMKISLYKIVTVVLNLSVPIYTQVLEGLELRSLFTSPMLLTGPFSKKHFFSALGGAPLPRCYLPFYFTFYCL